MMNNIKILHLGSDEKFIDQALKAFDRAMPEAVNDLYIFGRRNLKYLKTSPKKNVSWYALLMGSVGREFIKYDLVVLHSLNARWLRTIQRAPNHTPILWLGWGYDYYDVINNDSDYLLLGATRKEINNSLNKKISTKKIKKLISRLFLKEMKKSAIERISFFSPVLPSEYDLVKTPMGLRKFPKQVSWNYGNLEEDLIKNFWGERISGNNILLGNSATATNNHLDAFLTLSRIDGFPGDLIVPLSYGDFDYRDIVIDNGKTIFGEKFKPLIEFISIDQYVQIIKSCSIVVMNHVRQQAVGNIVIMLYLGAKIFLREESPAYEFFQQQGAILYTVQELERNPSLLSEPLAPNCMEVNRQVVMRHWSREVAERKTSKLLEQVLSSPRERGNIS